MSGITSVFLFLALLNAFLDYLVRVSLQFTKAGPGEQWALVHYHSSLTDKGVSVMDAIVTIIHNVTVFFAQISTLLPAQAGA